MHIHILGISGTFMSAIALLARELGFKVTGSDAACYPPISDLLTSSGIDWTEGYDDTAYALKADLVIVGNAMKRGMPVVEAILNARKPYQSGPAWLAEHVLSRYKVMAVAGTHGKTTTTSMLAWILEHAGLQPGFLIGGVASHFKTSNRLGKGDWFVIEADEYDSAFFDKRPKFMHYRPNVAILNNLEFDHADIYQDLKSIQQQFHYLLRTIPANGLVIKPRDDVALNEVLRMGCYTDVQTIALKGDAPWCAELLDESGASFNIRHHHHVVATVHWDLIGEFNVENALAAVVAAHHVGVSPKDAANALNQFIPVKRRLEIKHQSHVVVYDDFAHHPTAIQRTIKAVQESGRHQRVLVVLECASYTMKSGIHADTMSWALESADVVFVFNGAQLDWINLMQKTHQQYQIYTDIDDVVAAVVREAKAGDAILVMSNRGFENIHQKLKVQFS